MFDGPEENRAVSTTTNAALSPAGKNAASHCAIGPAHSTGEKSGPPGQGIPGRAYQIDAGWMGGASIDRSRRGRSVDAGLADIVAVGVELTDPMAGPISGGHPIGGGVAGGCCRADEGADAEADAEADTPTTGLGLAGGEHGAHGEGG